MIAKFALLPSLAAELAAKTGRDLYHSLAILESGRNRIAGTFMDLQEDLTGLEWNSPQLAKRFISLQRELDLLTIELDPRVPMHEYMKQSRDITNCKGRLHEVLCEIRTVPGSEEFLLPASEESLKAAASLGPIIVVNASDFRSTAYIIEQERIRYLPLVNVNLKMAKKWARKLRESRPPNPYTTTLILHKLWCKL